jgi:lipopolysaccharide export system permease protein
MFSYFKIPVVWRYLLSNYFKVLILCVFAFIAMLLTTRLDEIAHFAALGPEGLLILTFALNQIPYVLPIALPIACLISTILLIQRLSRTHELTALRAAGLGINEILAPILIAATFLAATNFFIVSELATHSHLTTSLLKNELRAVNPLLLLHNKHLMKLKGIFFNTLGPSKLGESSNELIIA